jgi:hypothetical protein
MIQALIIIVVIAIFASAYVALRTRGARDIGVVAKNNIRNRALSRKNTPVSDVLEQCLVPEDQLRAGVKLIELLSDLLDVPLSKFGCDIVLREMLQYQPDELTEYDGQVVEPFTYQLIERVAMLSDKGLWEKQWQDDPELPRTEEDLADFVVSMDLCSFIRFFAPLVNAPAPGRGYRTRRR